MTAKQTAQKNRPRLGRGLSSLISVSHVPVEADVPKAVDADSTVVTIASDGKPKEIPLGEIRPNPHQPRRKMDESTLRELAISLKSNGLIQPIVVRKVDDGYELIAGERRWRAAQIAGLSTIPAIVREVDSFTQAQMALVENIQREDLNPIDRAEAYRSLMDQLGLTQAELAGRLGEERSGIANFLRLLGLAEPVKQLIRSGQLSLGHAKLLAGVADILEQQRLAQMVVAQELSVRNLERLLEAGPAESPAPTRSPATAHYAELEQRIARQLGMRVQVKSTGKKGKGRLVVHYASLDQFDELMTRLGVTTE